MYLRVLEKRMLRRIYEANREEVIGNWRKLQTRSFLIYILHYGNQLKV
jgi:hypothetical protein